MKNKLFKLTILGIVYSVLFPDMGIDSCLAQATPSKDHNYIYVKTMTEKDGSECRETVQYFDAFGRLSQSVAVGITPQRNNLISMFEYNSYGDVEREWLPALVASTNKGKYMNPGNVMLGSILANGDMAPYTNNEYKNSFSSLITASYGPGNEWKEKSVGIKNTYSLNIAGRTGYDDINGTVYTPYRYDGEANKVNRYPESSLFITKTAGEDGDTLYQYTDARDRLIYSRKFIERQTSAYGYEFADTQYIYDDLGRLLYVLPPMAIDRVGGYSGITESVYHEYTYYYKYDYRDRKISVHKPYCGFETYIYDKANRLVFSRNPEQGKEEICFYKYDTMGRLIMKGICSVTDITSLRERCKDILMEESFDKNQERGYTWTKLTDIIPSSSKILNLYYYDSYDIIGYAGINAYEHEKHNRHGDDYYCGDEKGYEAKGLLTVSSVALLDGSGTLLNTYYYYDMMKRVVGIVSDGYIGNMDIARNKETEYFSYSFTGQVKKRFNFAAISSHFQTHFYEYDFAGRLISTRRTIMNDVAKPYEYINTYDELGCLVKTTPFVSSNERASTTYKYNVRSWLTSLQHQHFGEELEYTYGGNISKQTLNTGETYTFSYDKLSRLKTAKHSGNSIDRSVNYFYDKNGNITTLLRNRDLLDVNKGQERISVTYRGNQILTATSLGDVNIGFPYEFKDYSDLSKEYEYNLNGAIVKDFNKGISSIEYNLLNLPTKIDIKNPEAEARIEYLYDANGRKLEVTHRWNSSYSSTPIIGSAINESSLNRMDNTIYYNDHYRQGTHISDYGYTTVAGWNTYFYVKDHLGNVRAVIDESDLLKQKNEYYPFGLPTITSTEPGFQSFKYNGKELDTMHGLNLYDYHSRYMDPALPGFTTPDPLAEMYYDISPYAYCLNNPVKYIDPDGRSTWVMSQADGTYKVIGGDLDDDDKNIYVYTFKNGDFVRGESIGVTTSITSFFDSDRRDGKGAWATSAIIDPNDKSGDEFLSNIIGRSPSMVKDYMANATAGKKYDFKRTNGTEAAIPGISHYRGMPIGMTGNNETIYTSARDIGNIAAGYVAGINGLSWKNARLGFDGYQSIEDKKFSIEGISTRNAEYYGWKMGWNNASPLQKIKNFWSSIWNGM